jgi:hypothetical protein
MEGGKIRKRRKRGKSDGKNMMRKRRSLRRMCRRGK